MLLLAHFSYVGVFVFLLYLFVFIPLFYMFGLFSPLFYVLMYLRLCRLSVRKVFVPFGRASGNKVSIESNKDAVGCYLQKQLNLLRLTKTIHTIDLSRGYVSVHKPRNKLMTSHLCFICWRFCFFVCAYRCIFSFVYAVVLNFESVL